MHLVQPVWRNVAKTRTVTPDFIEVMLHSVQQRWTIPLFTNLYYWPKCPAVFNGISVVANYNDIDLREVNEIMTKFGDSLLRRCPFHDSLVYSVIMVVLK